MKRPTSPASLDTEDLRLALISQHAALRDIATAEIGLLANTANTVNRAEHEEQAIRAKASLQHTFGIKYFAKAQYILGLQLIPRDIGLSVTQRAHTELIFKLHGYNIVKLHTTPLVPRLKLYPSEEAPDQASRTRYRQLIGSLTYLAVGTHPDIAYAVSYLSRFNDTHDEPHLKALEGVFGYLRHAPAIGLLPQASATSAFSSFADPLSSCSDASYGDCVVTAASTFGWVILSAGAPVAWKSSRQTEIARSTSEAEYVALSRAAEAAQVLRNLLGELKLDISAPTKLFGDNSGVNATAANEKAWDRTRHIFIADRYIQRAFEMGRDTVEWVISAKACPSHNELSAQRSRSS